LVVLEANVDDVTGEVLAHAVGVLLDAGAQDAWITPIVMKKGRPAYTVSVLADAALVATLRGVLLDETGSLGVRAYGVERWAGPRHVAEVAVGAQRVRVKVSRGRVKAEYDDAARAASQLGLPVREVTRLAEAKWHEAETAAPDADKPDPHPPDGSPPSIPA
jgi:uncharacterized protein (DUF111 family)